MGLGMSLGIMNIGGTTFKVIWQNWMSNLKIKNGLNSGHYSEVVVPVFAFGPRTERLAGFMENTEITLKMIKLLIMITVTKFIQ